MILDSTTRKLQILLGATVNANQLPVTVDYVDFTSTTTTPAVQLSTTNSATAVDILSAPAASTQRKVNLITVANKDTDFVSVTIRLNDNATMYNYVASMALAPNSTLQFTDTRGWSIIDSNGNVLIAPTAVTDIQVFTANGIWTRPTGVTYTSVDCTGGGGGGAGGQGAAPGTTRSGGGGAGGGLRLVMQFLSAELTPFVGVTVASSQIGSAGGVSSAAVGALVGSTSRFGNFLVAYGGGGGGAVGGQGGGGGGGAGGSASGASATVGAGVAGGACATLTSAGSATPASVADHKGAGGSTGSATPNAGGSSYLGGGGGGGGSTSTNTAGGGGSSYFSASGGGGGGGLDTADLATLGGAGGLTGGAATGAGGGAASASINTGTASANGAAGDSTKAGSGGAGGASNNAGTGSAAGNGGTPGGGGGGGGAGLTTGGRGGVGAQGKVVVTSW
jgi:hypothetical protein